MPDIVPIRLAGFVAVVAVAAANIALNILVRKAATGPPTYLRALLSANFLSAIVVGTCSVLLLLLVYRLRVNLAQGVLLMGAASIVGGSLVGVTFFGSKLRIEEWLLLATIVVLFATRWVLVASK